MHYAKDVPAGHDLMGQAATGGDVEREVRLPWHPDPSSSLLLPWRCLNVVTSFNAAIPPVFYIL